MRTIHAKGSLDEDSLALCLNALRSGQIICYPTETFYALGIDPFNEGARAKLYHLKERDAAKDLPLIAANLAMVRRYCKTEHPLFSKLVSHFWPGALTLVLVSRISNGTVAIRVSSHRFARQLSAAFDAPVVSTSANVSGQAAIMDPGQLSTEFRNHVSVLIDAGKCKGGLPSTIVSLLEEEPKILRQGVIPAGKILSL